MKRFRNFVIGSLLLLVGVYFSYVALQLIGFQIDRAFLVEDMLHSVSTSSILANQAQIDYAERMFINNSSLAYFITIIPFGIVIFSVLTLKLINLGYRICYCNLYPKK